MYCFLTSFRRTYSFIKHTLQIPRYCKSTKEGGVGGQEKYQPNGHDFAYNRRCFKVILKGPGSLNFKKPVSAIRIKKEGVCYTQKI
jgi:hypothetical protein